MNCVCPPLSSHLENIVFKGCERIFIPLKSKEQIERRIKTLDRKVNSPATAYGGYLSTPKFYHIHGEIKALKWVINQMVRK